MKIPFERNNYFWGKMLSAEDFNAEQRYFDEKRCFLNRVIYGGGVICGLEVVKLDDKQISVQSGAALDFSGREIIVPESLVKNVSLIEGFSYGNKEGFVYLCIAFKEQLKDETTPIEGGDGKHYNRILESTKLYLTTENPATDLPIGRKEIRDLDEALDSGFNIYLAKINLVTGEKAFSITKVEDIRNKIVEKKLPEPLPDYSALFKKVNSQIERILKEYMQLAQMRPTIASGITSIDFALQGKRNRIFYSQPIAHGLGSGHVSISLAVIADKDRSYFDEHGIFGDAFAVAAAKVQVNDGTFILGVKITTDAPITKIKVHWTATRDNAFIPPEKPDCFISIKPGVANIARRERFIFEVDGFGVDKSDVIWTIKEAEGGVISKNGEYCAPSVPGVYEVQALAGKIKASAFVVVR